MQQDAGEVRKIRILQMNDIVCGTGKPCCFYSWQDG